MSKEPIPAEFASFLDKMKRAGLVLVLQEEYSLLCNYAAKGGYYGRLRECDSASSDRELRKDIAAAD